MTATWPDVTVRSRTELLEMFEISFVEDEKSSGYSEVSAAGRSSGEQTKYLVDLSGLITSNS